MAANSGFLQELNQIELPPLNADSIVSKALERKADGVYLDQISHLGLDNYRIALIPVESDLLGSRTDGPKNRAALVLPLTWKQLRALASSRLGDTYRDATFQFGEVHINFESMEVRRGESTVVLTCMEFKLLKFLVLNPSRVIPRTALLNQVWGYNDHVRTRTVDNHILRLRRKLESGNSRPVHFQTVHGVGYRFIPQALSESGSHAGRR